MTTQILIISHGSPVLARVRISLMRSGHLARRRLGCLRLLGRAGDAIRRPLPLSPSQIFGLDIFNSLVPLVVIRLVHLQYDRSSKVLIIYKFITKKSEEYDKYFKIPV